MQVIIYFNNCYVEIHLNITISCYLHDIGIIIKLIVHIYLNDILLHMHINPRGRNIHLNIILTSF